jgi:hypothetical protein
MALKKIGTRKIMSPRNTCVTTGGTVSRTHSVDGNKMVLHLLGTTLYAKFAKFD